MLKTRDLVIFFVVVLFLLVGITTTLIGDEEKTEVTLLSYLQPANIIDNFVVDSGVDKPDRQSNIERLKNAIANTSFISEAQPSVPREEVEEEDDAGEGTEDEVFTGEVLAQYCTGAGDGLEVVGRWPATGVVLEQVEGSRVVKAGVDASAVTLLQLPLYPFTSGAVSCLDTAVIGVTTSGSLLFNNDAFAYQYADSQTLIGYARDGFPIYGQYSGEVDECGGYQSPSGYRYSLASDRSFFIGCYAGSPQPFIF